MVDSVIKPVTNLFSGKAFQKQLEEEERAQRETDLAKGGARRILTNPALVEALDGPLAQYTEVSLIQLRRIVWSTFNYQDTGRINEDSVEFTVTSLGGTRSESRTLWQKLNPDGLDEIDFEAFVQNDFMNNYLRDNLSEIENAIEDLRIQKIINGTTVGDQRSILDNAGQQRSTGTIFDAEF